MKAKSVRPMTSDLDIYRSAHLLVKQHGEDVPIEAAMRADAIVEVDVPANLNVLAYLENGSTQ